jgi:hypothetical protein
MLILSSLSESGSVAGDRNPRRGAASDFAEG